MKTFSLEFENLGKAFSKAKSVIEKEGSIPQFFIRGLSDLEDFVKENWEDSEGRKKLNKGNARVSTENFKFTTILSNDIHCSTSKLVA